MTKFDYSRVSVLVIDDQPVIRAAVRSQLRLLGVTEIRLAADGPEGLALIAQEAPGCVLCDIDMRPMNGFEVVKRIRSGTAKVRRDLPIAMLTGHSDAEAVGTALALDVNAFIVKPVSGQELAARLSRAVTQPVAIADASHYAAIEVSAPAEPAKPFQPLPPSVLLTSSTPDDREVVRVALADVPANAELARALHAPNGKLLLGVGWRLNRATLDRLGDLLSVNPNLAYLYIFK